MNGNGNPLPLLKIPFESGLMSEPRGTYFHPDLALEVARWCNFKLAMFLNNIVKLYISNENKEIIR